MIGVFRELFLRKQVTQRADADPLVFTLQHRRHLVEKAMTGASVREQITLAYLALEKLSKTERERMVRRLDMEMWKEMEP